MANPDKKVKENIPGKFFVDTTCINCDACRKFAPSIFDDQGEFSYVKLQPSTFQEELESKMALLACPVGSIGMIGDKDLKDARKSFPVHLDGPVYLNGFNDEKTFGADSYFIKSNEGNWLIDSPRYVNDLVKAFESMGGIAYIFISHKDDIGNSAQYAKHFKARRIINKYDIKTSIADAEIILDGQEDLILDKAQIIHTPGHTKGSQVLLWDSKYLFTGDHYAYRRKINAFGSFDKACWYSWKEQISSVEKMKKFRDLEFIYPGHGRRGQIPKGEFPSIVEKSLQWMRSV